MDVTEASTPEEVIATTLDDYLVQVGEDEELDTTDLADNVVHQLRRAGFLKEETE